MNNWEIFMKYYQTLLMIIIKRFAPKFSRYFHSTLPPINSKYIYQFNFQVFCSIKRNKNFKELHENLLKDASKLNNKTIIKSLHLLTFRYQQANTQSKIIQNQQLEHLVQCIMNSTINSLSHQEITLFLQSLGEYQKYQKYNRNLSVYKQITKKLNKINSLILNQKYTYRLLHMLQKLDFPSMIVKKYLQYIANKVEKKQNEESIKPIDILRIFIIMIEKTDFPIQFIQKFYENNIEKTKFTSGSELSHLYYAIQKLPALLHGKSQYFQTKIEVYDVLFNPYTQKQDIVKAQKDTNPNQSQAQLKSASVSQKQLIQEKTEQFIKNINQKFNLTKIEQQLTKKYSYEYQPLNPALIILTLKLKALHQRFYQYFKSNYLSMIPKQYTKISQTLLDQHNILQLADIHRVYCDKCWNLLGISQKLILLQFGNKLKSQKQEKYFKINANVIKQIISQSHKITSQQFAILQQIIVRYIKPDQYSQILKQVQAIIDKMP